MIIAFSQNDGNDINQVLSDESFTRQELYTIANALENYYWEKFNQDNIDLCNETQTIKDKIYSLIQTDLKK